MMDRLQLRAGQLAAERQREKVTEVAARLSALLGDGAVETREARVLVRGRGIVKRWLIDPDLRFLGGGLK
jgi:hypothetical protein